MFCPPVQGQDVRLIGGCATYWSNSSCTELVCRAVTSEPSELNFAQIDAFDNAVELRGLAAGGVVAFHRRSRLLMFAHDTYSGTNGRLTPFVGIKCNQL